MRSVSGLLLALVLLLSGGWLGRVSDRMRAEAGEPRPPPGPASVLGGFSAIAIQILWIRADRALLGRQIDECLYYFELIHQLEPQLLDATAYFADEIGSNIASHEPDPERRFALAMLGRRMFDDSVAANRSDPRAYVARGRYTLTRMGIEHDTKRRFFEATGVTPFESAQNDFADAYERNPESIEAVDGFASSSYLRGMELFFLGLDRGDEKARQASGRAFRAAVQAYGAVLELQAARGFTREELEDEHLSLDGARRFLACAEAPAGRLPELYRALYALWEQSGNVAGWPPPFDRWPPQR